MRYTGFQTIRDLLSSPKQVLITAHTNPDGDAIGSALALYMYLKLKNHTVHVMVPDPFPSFLAWLPCSRDILVFNRDQITCLRLIQETSVIFSLDYNNLDRLGDAMEAVMNSEAVKVLIDHHIDPADHFSHSVSITNTSSTAELIFDFIDENGDKELITKEIAECIYTGIVTDTGSFSYACNQVKTYQVVAELVRLGIDGEHIHRLVYDTYSESRLRLLGYSLSDKLEVLPEYHTAFIVLSKAELDQFDYQIGDTEGIVNYALSMDNINLAALFSERDGKVKISFRSKGNFSVEQLARNHFTGGGHRNAAGATSDSSLNETIRLFRKILPIYQAQLQTVY